MSAIAGVSNPNAITAMNKARAERGIVGGIKTVVTPEIVAMARDYLNDGWMGEGIVIPTAEGLAGHLNIARSTLYDSKELADTLEQVQRLQASMVLNGALANQYNPAIAKLILSAKHGYVEKTEVANTHAITAQPQEAIAQDFSSYVKSKTQAIDSTATDTTPPVN